MNPDSRADVNIYKGVRLIVDDAGILFLWPSVLVAIARSYIKHAADNYAGKLYIAPSTTGRVESFTIF